MTTRQQVVDEARKWLGVRWHHQGRTTAGIDCIGLVIKVAHALELSTFDVIDYSRQPDPTMLKSLMAQHMNPVESQQVGDVLLMRFETEPQHVAILTETGIIHAYAQARKVVEHRFDSLWQSRVLGVFAYKGIE